VLPHLSASRQETRVAESRDPLAEDLTPRRPRAGEPWLRGPHELEPDEAEVLLGAGQVPGAGSEQDARDGAPPQDLSRVEGVLDRRERAALREKLRLGDQHGESLTHRIGLETALPGAPATHDDERGNILLVSSGGERETALEGTRRGAPMERAAEHDDRVGTNGLPLRRDHRQGDVAIPSRSRTSRSIASSWASGKFSPSTNSSPIRVFKTSLRE